MIGHEKIIQLRKVGKVPIIVFVDEYKVCLNWEEFNDHVSVYIGPEEPLELLDLRWSVGLVVSTGSTSEKRAKELLEAFKPYCNTVASSHSFQPEGKSYFLTEWSEVWHR